MLAKWLKERTSKNKIQTSDIGFYNSPSFVSLNWLQICGLMDCSPCWAAGKKKQELATLVFKAMWASAIKTCHLFEVLLSGQWKSLGLEGRGGGCTKPWWGFLSSACMCQPAAFRTKAQRASGDLFPPMLSLLEKTQTLWFTTLKTHQKTMFFLLVKARQGLCLYTSWKLS